MDGTSVGMQRLADSLAQTARTCSLDRMRDGPFARLAKENDILWSSGGRPDDITVVAVRLSTIPPKGPAPLDVQEGLRSFAEGLQAESAADAVTT
jgi:protein phosphatase PTC7